MIGALSHEGAFREAGLGTTCRAAALGETTEAQIGPIGEQTIRGVRIAIGAPITVTSTGAEVLPEHAVGETYVNTKADVTHLIGTAGAALRCHVAAEARSLFTETRGIQGTMLLLQGSAAELLTYGQERYRERHDDRNRNYISPGTDPRKGRGVDQYDPPSNKLDTRRTDKRRENETVERAARHSPDHDKGTRRLSPGESTMKIDGALRRPSRSIDRSHQAYQSESREIVAVEASKHSNQAKVPSRSRSLCRSADCPTPDLVSSRAFKTDSRETNSARPSLGPQEKLASEQETSPKRSDDNTSRERCADEAPAVAPRLTSEACAGVRQSPSASRSPSVRTGVPEGERHEGKEHEPSCPAAPLATEQPAPEKSTHLPEATAVSRGPGVCVQKGCAQEGELVQAQDELPTKVEEQPPPSVTQRDHCSPTQRHEERRLSEGPGLDDERQCDGRPVETPGANNMAPTAINCSRTTDELGTQRVRLPSEEIWRNAEADRIPVKRRIVTTEPITPLESAEAFRAYRGPSPRAYSRNQGFLRERGHRFLPGMNRFQPIGPTAWNRLDRDERFDFPQPLHPMSTGRSVRLVARRGDRNLLLPGQQFPRNANPYESQRVQLHNGIFEHSGPPNQRLFKRTPIHIQPAAERNRKTTCLNAFVSSVANLHLNQCLNARSG
ncbi:hypothetical protein, conserved [Eimeria praecox]|uniref:Uncharacterized protein n=1 Tax=Eimeria praecox TaxID=51316 RepID=U6H0U5_9EIME|nr:hypothetical protein, conserved [Eimeria praecox]